MLFRNPLLLSHANWFRSFQLFFPSLFLAEAVHKRALFPNTIFSRCPANFWAFFTALRPDSVWKNFSLRLKKVTSGIFASEFLLPISTSSYFFSTWMLSLSTKVSICPSALSGCRFNTLHKTAPQISTRVIVLHWVALRCELAAPLYPARSALYSFLHTCCASLYLTALEFCQIYRLAHFSFSHLHCWGVVLTPYTGLHCRQAWQQLSSTDLHLGVNWQRRCTWHARPCTVSSTPVVPACTSLEGSRICWAMGDTCSSPCVHGPQQQSSQRWWTDPLVPACRDPSLRNTSGWTSKRKWWKGHDWRSCQPRSRSHECWGWKARTTWRWGGCRGVQFARRQCHKSLWQFETENKKENHISFTIF